MGLTWGPPGSCRPQMGPLLAPWTLLSGVLILVWSAHKMLPRRCYQGDHLTPVFRVLGYWLCCCFVPQYEAFRAQPLHTRPKRKPCPYPCSWKRGYFFNGRREFPKSVKRGHFTGMGPLNFKKRWNFACIHFHLFLPHTLIGIHKCISALTIH